jgi:hypothetical protein
MKQEERGSAQPGNGGIRSGVWAGLALLVVVAIVLGYGIFKRSPQAPETAPPDTGTQVTEMSAPGPSSPTPSSPPGQVVVNPPPEGGDTTPPTGSSSAGVNTTSAAPRVVPPGPAVSPLTRQLVANLSDLKLENNTVTPEQAAAWKEALQKLNKEGAAAVPAIREFLEKNVDLDFQKLADGDQMGYPSLRLALLDSLKQIGGPEAIAASVHTLQTTTDPREIALLAGNLEEASPGEYRDPVLAAVRSSLSMAANQQLEGRDVNPLFEVLQKYGSTSDLENAAQRWHYYSTMALAGVAEGGGISALMKLAEPDSGMRVSTRGAALAMLAQSTDTSSEARDFLIAQAQQSKIPNVAWQDLAAVLSGSEYQFKNQFFERTTAPPVEASKVKEYHIAFGNQNFYTFNAAETWTPDQFKDRLALLDQFISVTSDPVGIESLIGARNRLVELSQRPPATPAAPR